MEQLLLVFYVLLSAGIVGLILLQQGKGADMGASFGAGASQTVFGSGGAGNLLTRSTAILATLFFISSVGLAMMAKHKAEEARTGAIEVPAAAETRDNVPPSKDDVPASASANTSSEQDAATPGAEFPAAPAEQAPAAQQQPGAAGEVPVAPAEEPAPQGQ